MILRPILLACSILASILIGFVFLETEALQSLLRALTWPTLAIALSSFIYYLIRTFKGHLIDSTFSEANRYVIIACLLGTIFICTREAPGYKVVFDEPTIINTSLNLHEIREPVKMERVHNEVESVPAIDKRPFLFAFVVSIFHDIFGYRIANGHIVNYLLTFLLFVTFFSLLTSLKNRRAGYIGIACLTSHPLLAQNASGLGFEIANLLFLSLAMLVATLYWRDPKKKTLGCLVFTAILLAHTRYESAAYALPIGAIVLTKWISEKRISITFSLIACPLFYIPLVWQNRIVQENARLYIENGSDKLFNAFGAAIFPENLSNAIHYFSGLDHNLAGSIILGPAGILATTALIIYIAARPKLLFLKSNLWPVIAIASMTILLFFLLMSYFWGNLSDPVATRLSLPLWLLLIISLSISLSHLQERFKHISTIVVGLAFLHALPAMSAHKYSESNLITKRFDWVMDTIGHELSERTLVISNTTSMFQNQRIPSLNIRLMNYDAESIHLHQSLNTYDSIYLIQYGHQIGIDPANDFKINRGFEAGPMFKLEPIAEASLTPYNFVRISKISGIDLETYNLEREKPPAERPYLSYGTTIFMPVSKAQKADWEASFPFSIKRHNSEP